MVALRKRKAFPDSANPAIKPDSTIPVYKKVSKSGKARYLSVTKLVPEDWIIVEVTTVSLENNILSLRLRKVA